MKRKNTALMLNAFVLPGLGQLYLGRRSAGIIIILLVNLVLLLGVFVLLKGLAPVIAARMISGSFNPDELAAALKSVSGLAGALLAGFALLWGVSIVDVLKNGSNDNQSESLD